MKYWEFESGQIKSVVIRGQRGSARHLEFDRDGKAKLDGKIASSFDVQITDTETEHFEFDQTGTLGYVSVDDSKSHSSVRMEIKSGRISSTSAIGEEGKTLFSYDVDGSLKKWEAGAITVKFDHGRPIGFTSHH